jgi:Zn-dependent alcohol dehydrogenase
VGATLATAVPRAAAAAAVRGCAGVGLAALGLCRMPRRADGVLVDWAEGIRGSWRFGEDAVRKPTSRCSCRGVG